MSDGNKDQLSSIRKEIDQIDYRLVEILKERQDLVNRASSLKKNEHAVRDSSRVEEVIKRVRGLAEKIGMSPEIVEKVYRPMIDAYIEYGMGEYRSSHTDREVVSDDETGSES